jgi:SH3-like domain-containing protein
MKLQYPKEGGNLSYHAPSVSYRKQNGTSLGCGVLILFIIGVIWFIAKTKTSPPSLDVGRNEYSDSYKEVGTTRSVNAPQLNMRSGPGANYPVVKTFDRNEIIVSIGEPVNVNGESWIRVSARDGQIRGWANRKYLSP